MYFPKMLHSKYFQTISGLSMYMILPIVLKSSCSMSSSFPSSVTTRLKKAYLPDIYIDINFNIKNY